MTSFLSENKFFGDLLEIIEKNIIPDKEKIEEFYAIWKEKFENSHDKILTEFIPKKIIHSNLGLPEDSETCGIDLPSWFGSASGKKIMFVGLDPMRSEKEFSQLNHANKTDHVIIGTPYALHNKHFRTSRSKLYWKLIEGLSKDNFIYLTDVYKSFFYTGNNIRSYNFYSRNSKLKHRHHHIFEQELKLVQPDIIITFGKKSYEIVANKRIGKVSDSVDKNISKLFINENKSALVIPLIHLSGSVRINNLEIFLRNNSIYKNELDRNECPELFLKLLNRFL